MKRLPRFAVLVVLLGCFCAGSAGRIVHAGDLAAEIRTVLQDKALAKGEAGVEILRLPGGANEKPQIIFRHNSDIPLIPASNLKLVTTSAFLDRFGPQFKYRTMLVKRGEDLVLVGDGDPSFGDAELLKRFGWESTTVYKNWAAMLKQHGITSVRDVVVDDSICDEDFVHPNWPAKQQHFRYVAGVAGMNFNANALDFFLHTSEGGGRVTYNTDPPTRYANVTNDCVSGRDNSVWLSRSAGANNIDLKGQTNADNVLPVSVTIHDPAMYAATVLSETLQSQGIHVSGAVKRDRTIRAMLSPSSKSPATQPATTTNTIVLAIHETPIATVLGRANKDSMNVYAEAMCKRLGAEISGAPGSWENGTAAMREFVKRCGVSESEFDFDDGCGLSKKNGVSANAIARVLAYDFAGKSRDVFMTSLSIAGVDGTLDNRFKDSDLRGRVMGKSGFVAGVSSLSGFVKSRDGQQWYAFSILMNGVGDVATCKLLQERIVKAIDGQNVNRLVSGE